MKLQNEQKIYPKSYLSQPAVFKAKMPKMPKNADDKIVKTLTAMSAAGIAGMGISSKKQEEEDMRTETLELLENFVGIKSLVYLDRLNPESIKILNRILKDEKLSHEDFVIRHIIAGSLWCIQKPEQTAVINYVLDNKGLREYEVFGNSIEDNIEKIENPFQSTVFIKLLNQNPQDPERHAIAKSVKTKAQNNFANYALFDFTEKTGYYLGADVGKLISFIQNDEESQAKIDVMEKFCSDKRLYDCDEGYQCANVILKFIWGIKTKKEAEGIIKVIDKILSDERLYNNEKIISLTYKEGLYDILGEVSKDGNNADIMCKNFDKLLSNQEIYQAVDKSNNLFGFITCKDEGILDKIIKNPKFLTNRNVFRFVNSIEINSETKPFINTILDNEILYQNRDLLFLEIKDKNAIPAMKLFLDEYLANEKLNKNEYINGLLSNILESVTDENIQSKLELIREYSSNQNLYDNETLNGSLGFILYESTDKKDIENKLKFLHAYLEKYQGNEMITENLGRIINGINGDDNDVNAKIEIIDKFLSDDKIKNNPKVVNVLLYYFNNYNLIKNVSLSLLFMKKFLENPDKYAEERVAVIIEHIKDMAQFKLIEALDSNENSAFFEDAELANFLENSNAKNYETLIYIINRVALNPELIKNKEAVRFIKSILILSSAFNEHTKEFLDKLTDIDILYNNLEVMRIIDTITSQKGFSEAQVKLLELVQNNHEYFEKFSDSQMAEFIKAAISAQVDVTPLLNKMIKNNFSPEKFNIVSKIFEREFESDEIEGLKKIVNSSAFFDAVNESVDEKTRKVNLTIYEFSRFLVVEKETGSQYKKNYEKHSFSMDDNNISIIESSKMQRGIDDVYLRRNDINGKVWERQNKDKVYSVEYTPDGKQSGYSIYTKSPVKVGEYDLETKTGDFSSIKAGEKENSYQINKSFSSDNGTKTEYNFKSEPTQSSMDYRIISKNGKTLFKIDRKFFKLSENKTRTELNGQVYETIFEENKIISKKLDKNGNVVETVELNSNQLDFSLMKLYKQLPADYFFDLKNLDIRVRPNGLSDMNNACATIYNSIDLSEELKLNPFVFAHELGHRKDALMYDSFISSDKKLKKIFEKEMEAFKKTKCEIMQTQIIYFMVRGLKEVVAETCALISGLHHDNWDDLGTRSIILQQYFPETIAYIANKLNG